MCKLIRETAAFIMVIMMVSLLAGCNNDELALYNAMTKLQDVTYIEQNTDVSFRFDYTGERNEILERVKLLLNGFKFSVMSKQNINNTKDIMSAGIDALITLEDLTYNYKLWLDANMTEKNPYYKQIIRIPFIARIAMPNEYGGKEYMVLDSTKINEEDEEAAAFTDLPMINKKIISKSNDIIKKYMAGFKPEVKIVHKGSVKNYNGERMTVYELRMDDSSFKSLAKQFVNYFAKDEEAMGMFKEIMFSAYDLYGIDKNIAFSEFEKQIEDMFNNVPAFLEQFNEFMAELENIRVLGNDGIRFTYLINKNGYIVKEVGSIDLIANIKELAKTFDISEEDIGFNIDVINMGIDLDCTYDKFNKPEKINIPDVNEENSIDLFTMMKNMEDSYDYSDYSYIEEEEPEQPGLKVKYFGRRIDFQNEIISANDTIYVPAAELLERIYSSAYWEDETKTLYGFTRGCFIKLSENSDVIYKQGERYTLSHKSYIKDDVLYVPLRSFMEILGFKIIWDEESETVNIESNFTYY